jgi:hypothetical protein
MRKTLRLREQSNGNTTLVWAYPQWLLAWHAEEQQP